MFDAKGAKVGEESGDISRIGDSEGMVGAVVVGFDVIEGRKARNKKGEVRGVVVLDAEVGHHQDKGNRARVWWKSRVGVWWKSKYCRRETRRRLESLPGSFRPYIIFLCEKRCTSFPLYPAV